MMKFFKYCFVSLFLFSLLAAAVGAGGLYYLIAVVPAPELEESSINEILGRESPVFYRDGQTKLGVLFEGIHRQYLPYKDIPPTFINALIAAEDDQFFSHFGLDIPGIVRAMLVNFRAGKVVQGGSTITQQTAKNLFKGNRAAFRRRSRSCSTPFDLNASTVRKRFSSFIPTSFLSAATGMDSEWQPAFFSIRNPKI